MDVGVGSFVFSLGIVSTRNFTSERQSGTAILKSVRAALPVLGLGMVRVVMVKGVEYPVCPAAK
jgi:phosphatidylinositol glycan class W